MKREFNKKVVLITGAAGGIGSALAHRFGDAGAKIGIMDHDQERLDTLKGELIQKEIECHAAAFDITDEQACGQAFNVMRHTFNTIDVLINTAGIPQRSAFVETSAAVYHRVMAVNFFGSLYSTQAVTDDLIASQGIIIVISSVAGFAPLIGRAAYAASKHALHGLFDTLRVELKPHGVNVMLVCPSFVNTDFRFRALDGDGSVTNHPQSTVGNIITPEAAANMIFSAAGRNKPRLILSTAGKASWWISRIIPSLYATIMTRSLKSELERHE